MFDLEELRLKNNVEILKMYVKEMLSNRPSMEVVEVLDKIMGEKNIEPTGMNISFKFKVDGRDVTVNAASL